MEEIRLMPGVTRERTRQLEARAYAQLRDTLRPELSRGLEECVRPDQSSGFQGSPWRSACWACCFSPHPHGHHRWLRPDVRRLSNLLFGRLIDV